MRTEVLNTARFDSVVNGAWHWVAARFRRQRRAMLLGLFPASSFAKVIDVGGIAKDWQDDNRVITILNLISQDCGRHRFISGDARHIECDADSSQSSSALGPETSGRSGLEVRVRRRIIDD